MTPAAPKRRAKTPRQNAGMSWRREIEPYVRPLFHAYVRRARGLTLGVRGIVTDAAGRVLLVEHTYVPGWYLPGGGVERRETAETALARELLEEAGVIVRDRPRLVSVHDNGTKHPGDHVLLYRIGAWSQGEATQKGEIARTGFFAPDALPDGATQATRRRLAETLGGTAADPAW